MINVNLLYPIGSIYISVNGKNPSEIFGGTWERIKGKMLLGVDEDDQDFLISGKTGGEKEVTLTVDQIPPHKHQAMVSSLAGSDETITRGTTKGVWRSLISSAGGGQAHNNMPPYFTCYIWYRTA